MERPKVPVGPPHGGDREDGFCCGHPTYDDKHVEENREAHRSTARWFVEGTWQCHIMEHHHGTLTPMPIQEES